MQAMNVFAGDGLNVHGPVGARSPTHQSKSPPRTPPSSFAGFGVAVATTVLVGTIACARGV
ncbi:MAG: hypothetical protein ACREMY_02970, partial [bacterium]